ncbi:MAG: peroxiredoxin [Caldimicrobium sp.]|nr:peroxiredoxin [Caldimicrobium sp.]MCX7873641.1 peroxiredoxin [Caldimicrobium sp.]MDW8094332.1 peroxiredoxin [Caldimicrobium sp.]
MEFNERLDAFYDHGVQIIGISKDSPESHRKFKAEKGILFPLLSDPKLELHRAFGVLGVKRSPGRNVERVIRSTFILNESGAIIWSKKGVKVKGHGEEVLRIVKGLTKGA